MYIVLLQDEYSVVVFQVQEIYGIIQFQNLFVDFFLSRRPSFGDRKVLKSPTMTVLWSFCDLKSTSVCLMNLFALALGKYILVIVISS
jgi:hypothetical protein